MQATSKRRGQGEDSIYWDASENRYVGAVSLGFGLSGTRIRKKVRHVASAPDGAGRELAAVLPVTRTRMTTHPGLPVAGLP
jgi:hypothetical protein